jgi:hypothetical protein
MSIVGRGIFLGAPLCAEYTNVVHFMYGVQFDETHGLFCGQICRVEDVDIYGEVSGSVVHIQRARNVTISHEGVLSASGLGTSHFIPPTVSAVIVVQAFCCVLFMSAEAFSGPSCRMPRRCRGGQCHQSGRRRWGWTWGERRFWSLRWISIKWRLFLRQQ